MSSSLSGLVPSSERMSSARAVLTLVLERCSPSSVARPEVKK